MSTRYPGGIVKAIPVTPTGPLQDGTAPGMWTLDQAEYWTKQGLWPIAGNFLAVEDVFSTYLYTGNGSTQTITNGIDLAGKGGMVWLKSRSAATNNFLFDTTRGVNVEINSNTTDANATLANSLTAFNSNGFALGSAAGINVSAATYASWTFREAPKFFDVVTYTGNGSNTRRISHNLGVTPGFIVVKKTSAAQDWVCAHRYDNFGNDFKLNTANASFGGGFIDTPNATSFGVNAYGNPEDLNTSGDTYVAYLYAHDAASDGIIQCGSYTGNGSTTGPVINLGWEPQWLLVKPAGINGTNWLLMDAMRGFDYTQNAFLHPNLSDPENYPATMFAPTSTGFELKTSWYGANSSGQTYIYIAIRRGPMKTPTSGTSVFSPNIWTGNGASGDRLDVGTTGFPIDTQMIYNRAPVGQTSGYNYGWLDRLRGVPTYPLVASGTVPGFPALYTTETAAQSTLSGPNYFSNTAFGIQGNSGALNVSGWTFVSYNFRRAPGFFDVVCYTGPGGSAQPIPHNLGVTPELVIVKCRSNSATYWPVYAAPLGYTKGLALNSDGASADEGWGAAPTATNFYVSFYGSMGTSGRTYVAYLFASAPGVSKVGSFTGNGSSQTINCGFAAGARFVMIKRTDSTGDWYVWDTARGMVAGNDPHLSLNTTAAEVTTDDSVDTDNTGFIVNQVSATNVNVNGASYIYLAVA